MRSNCPHNHRPANALISQLCNTAASAAGKTFSMQGDYTSQEGAGVIPRALRDLFDRLQANTDSQGWVYDVAVSFLEVYHEDIYDLLAPPEPVAKDSRDMRERDRLAAGGGNTRVPLKLTNTGTDSPVIKGLTRVPVTSAEEALAALNPGFASRRTGSTGMNAQSSRSHAVVTVYVNGSRTVDASSSSSSSSSAEQDEENAGAAGGARLTYTRRAVMDIVDLAGSERAKATGNEGAALKEAGSINKSLMTLKQVVQQLYDKQQGASTAAAASVVPWRDSTLTQILRRSLGGNSRTVIIATLSPALENWPESCSTLMFAAQVRSLKTVYTQNETATAAGGGGGGAIVDRSRESALEKEIQRLREENGSLRGMIMGVGTGAGASLPFSNDDGSGDNAAAIAGLLDKPTAIEGQLTSAISIVEGAIKLAGDVGASLEAAAAKLDEASGLVLPSAALSTASSSSSSAPVDIAQALRALAQDALASKRRELEAAGYKAQYEAAEAQLALLQPAQQYYYATAGSSAAKRQRMGDGSALGTTGGAPGSDASSSSAGPLSGHKRGRAEMEPATPVSSQPAGFGAPTPMYRHTPAMRAALGEAELTDADLVASSDGSSASSGRGASSSAELQQQLAAARAAGVTEGYQQASLSLEATSGALSVAIDAFAQYCAQFRSALAAARPALVTGREAATALIAALTSGVTTAAAAADGEDNVTSSFGVPALLQQAAEAVKVERTGRVMACAEAAAMGPRLSQLAAQMTSAKQRIDELQQANAGLESQLHAAQQLGLQAVAENKRLKDELVMSAAATAKPAAAAEPAYAFTSTTRSVGSSSASGRGVASSSSSGAMDADDDVAYDSDDCDGAEREGEDQLGQGPSLAASNGGGRASGGGIGGGTLSRVNSSCSIASMGSSSSMRGGGGGSVILSATSLFSKVFQGIKEPAPVATVPVPPANDEAGISAAAATGTIIEKAAAVDAPSSVSVPADAPPATSEAAPAPLLREPPSVREVTAEASAAVHAQVLPASVSGEAVDATAASAQQAQAPAPVAAVKKKNTLSALFNKKT